mmetsp:Transcript_25797/g.59387  ORF Transcript_25797/g.59387 Transcript_25797/m.59387 type:complete len:570 (-) Transcript_25797:343-2052(-)
MESSCSSTDKPEPSSQPKLNHTLLPEQLVAACDQVTSRAYFDSSYAVKRQWDEPPVRTAVRTDTVINKLRSDSTTDKKSGLDVKTRVLDQRAIKTRYIESPSRTAIVKDQDQKYQYVKNEERGTDEGTKGESSAKSKNKNDKAITQNFLEMKVASAFSSAVLRKNTLKPKSDASSSFEKDIGRDVCAYLGGSITDAYRKKKRTQLSKESIELCRFADSTKSDTDLWTEVVTTVHHPINYGQLAKRSYFINERTKEKRWDFPPTNAQNVINFKDSAIRRDNGPTVQRRGKATLLRRRQKSDTWVEVVDHSGRSYFYSIKTKRIVWDCPPSEARFVMYVSHEMRQIMELCTRNQTLAERNKKKDFCSTKCQKMVTTDPELYKFSNMSSKNTYKYNNGSKSSIQVNAKESYLSKPSSKKSSSGPISGEYQKLAKHLSTTKSYEAGVRVVPKIKLQKCPFRHDPYTPKTSSPLLFVHNRMKHISEGAGEGLGKSADAFEVDRYDINMALERYQSSSFTMKAKKQVYQKRRFFQSDSAVSCPSFASTSSSHHFTSMHVARSSSDSAMQPPPFLF